MSRGTPSPHLTFVESAPKWCHKDALLNIIGTWKHHDPVFVSIHDLKQLRRRVDHHYSSSASLRIKPDRLGYMVWGSTPILMSGRWTSQARFDGWRGNAGRNYDAASLIYIDDYLAFMYRQIERKDVRSAIDMMPKTENLNLAALL